MHLLPRTKHLKKYARQVLCFWIMFLVLSSLVYLPMSPVSEVREARAATVTISGIVYSSFGGSNIGSGKTINVYQNGSTLVGSNSTAAGGSYSVTGTINASDVVTVYIDGDAVDANTVFVSDATNNPNVDLYGSVLAVGHHTGSSITHSNPSTGYVSGDGTDMVYSVTSGNLTTSSNGSGY